jgi:proteic killer suppression protein
MIKSFADKRGCDLCILCGARAFTADSRPPSREAFSVGCRGKLDDLRVPPGNRLEVPRGDRQGQHSFRINDQWRLCFVWHDGAAWDVEVADYH